MMLRRTFGIRARHFGSASVASVSLLGCEPVPATNVDVDPSDSAALTDSDVAGGGVVAIRSMAVAECGEWRPILHGELSYSTPEGVRARIAGIELMRERTDETPVVVPLAQPDTEADLFDGALLASGEVPAGEYRYVRIDVAQATFVVGATAHVGMDVPGTLELDIAAASHTGDDGPRAQGDVRATFSAFGSSFSTEYSAPVNCPLSWNGGYVDTSAEGYRVTVPVPGGVLEVEPGATNEIELVFPIGSSFGWDDRDEPQFSAGVFDIAPDVSTEMPGRLFLCDLLLSDRCLDEAQSERVDPAWAMPDSGTTHCVGDLSAAVCPESGEPAYGQDGNYDVNSPSYAVADGVVTDTITGLVWQEVAAPHELDWWGARDYCSGLVLGGRDDWTLPSRLELTSLLDLGRLDPSIDLAAFPDSPAEFFWSASPAAFSGLAYGVRFDQGYLYDHDPRAAGRVRCVANASASGFGTRFVVAGSVVSDATTGLSWARHVVAAPSSWEGALAACEDLVLDGHEDFRAPTAKELSTLVDETRVSPSIDVVAFPTAQAVWVWSSSPAAEYGGYAWAVSFTDGYSTPAATGELYEVRCVR